LEVIYFGRIYSFKGEKGTLAQNIEIIKPKRRLKNLVDMMQALVDGGWAVDNDGNFVNSGHSNFCPVMWQECGKTEDEWDKWEYDPSWIEEVE